MPRLALALFRHPPGPERARDVSGETAPRGFLFEEAFDRLYDLSILDSARHPTSPLERRLPSWMRLALEIHRRRDEYDAVVTWGERLTRALMAVQQFASGRRPHIAMLYWMSKPNISIPLRAFGDKLHAIVTWTAVQRTYAMKTLRIPPQKIYLVDYQVDQLFYRPHQSGDEVVCSAGSEMRDYPTLIEALRGTNIPCHIASDHVRVVGRFSVMQRYEGIASLKATAGPNVTIAPSRTPLEQRRLYDRSRFVVVPVLPSDTDNGLTVALEAMAMAKPVICTQTRGLAGLFDENVEGVYVPPREPMALRRAILALWNDPERARAMGKRARALVEERHTLEAFARNVRRAVEASLEGRGAASDGAIP